MSDSQSGGVFQIQFSNGFAVLQTETERVLNATTREGVCEAVHSAVHTLFDTKHSHVFLYSRREESLTTLLAPQKHSVHESLQDTNTGTPRSASDSTGCDGVVTVDTVHQDVSSVLWDVYGSSSARLLAEDGVSGVVAGGAPHEAAITVPLGPYGVLLVVEPPHRTFTDIDASVAEFLGAAITRALDSERRSRGLAMVQAVSQDAMTAVTHEEMGAAVLDQLPEVLDYPLCAVWEYNPVKHRLEPIATTGPAQELIPDHPVFEPGESIAWDVFENGGTRVISDVASHDDSYNPDSPIQSEVLTAIGDFGVFAAGSTRSGSFNQTEKEIIESLSTNLQTIVKLVERHGELQLLDDVLGRVIRHNIRNELNVIKGNGDVIRESDPDSDVSAEFYERFVEACDRLERTAENAQLMRDVVGNRSNMIDVSIDRVVEDAVTSMQREYEAAEITFHCDCVSNPGLLSVHSSFQSGVEELISNAVTHADTPSEVVVDVRVTCSGDGDTVRVVVSDNGPGIPDDERRVLDGAGESSLRHGSGAGLWVVDRVVQYSGGELEFTIDDGTVATITLHATQ